MFRRLLQNKGLCSENLQQLLPDTGDQVYSDASCSRIADMLGTDVNTVMSLKGLVEKVQLSSMSTSYSGIDAPGVSVLNLLSYAQEELAMTVTHPEHVFASAWITVVRFCCFRGLLFRSFFWEGGGAGGGGG